MAAATFAGRESGKLVQTRFDFDSVQSEATQESSSSRNELGAVRGRTSFVANPVGFVATPVGADRMRRGECRHVGGALVSVLGKYGLTVDALLDEIERQKAMQDASGVLVQ
ncbi:hypothetical protein SH467x_003598 [Pirellulaceae bacterium SH467]|jgi:hypothetical protein